MSGFVVSKPEQSHHRLFDFAKTAIINIFAHPYATVSNKPASSQLHFIYKVLSFMSLSLRLF